MLRRITRPAIVIIVRGYYRCYRRYHRSPFLPYPRILYCARRKRNWRIRKMGLALSLQLTTDSNAAKNLSLFPLVHYHL